MAVSEFVSSAEVAELAAGVAGMAKDRIHPAAVPLPNPGGLRTIPYASPYLRTPVLQTRSQSSVSGLGRNLENSDSAIYEYAVGLRLIERRPLLRGLKVFLGVDRGLSKVRVGCRHLDILRQEFFKLVVMLGDEFRNYFIIL